jgi:UDP-N-acetylmuramate--alanine ligase
MIRERVRKVHFVGIGGIGMSGIARDLLEMGYRITGSDIKENTNTSLLRKLGARIFIGHSPGNVEGDVDVVVYSSAIGGDNPELLRAKELGIPVIPRGEMLAELFRLKEGIAISGSHGKTTTTSMVASILETAGFDPTVIIGGKLKRVGGNAKLGSGDLLVSEADESDGSFLKLSPIVAVVTNIDREHLDHYGSYDRLLDSFREFVDSVPFYGFSVVNSDDPGVKEIIKGSGRRVVTCSVEGEGEVVATSLRLVEGRYSFKLIHEGKELGSVHLGISGKHNVYNALLACGVALKLDIDFSLIKSALENFKNAERRMDFKGFFNGAPVYDDYGHHPTEIRSVISALREMYPGRKIVLVFQPHRYSRTHLLFKEFSEVLPLADRTFLLEIFPAGEVNTYGVRASELARESGATFVEDPSKLHDLLVKMVDSEAVLLFMGAGDIAKICEKLIYTFVRP